MASIFTRIIDGEIPGRFVWKDEQCVVFGTIAPLRPGHMLVIPRVEVDHWIDLDPELNRHLSEVAQIIGQAQQQAFSPTRIGLIIAGMEVPHTHLHVIPIESEADLDFSRADPSASAESLEQAAEAVRAALRSMGRTEVVDA
ncbi:MAG: HIT family protein [Aquihabitans sp.]